MTTLLAVLGLAACLARPAAADSAPLVTIIVDRADAEGQALGRQLAKRLKDRADVQWLDYSASSRGNPVEKGRLLASMAAAGLIVPVGNEPTSFALDELEDTPVYFVDASAAPGGEISNAKVSGLFSYSAQDVLAAVPGSWKRGLGILYSPGYEPLVAQIRTLAKSSGVVLFERRAARPSDIPPAAQDLLGRAKAIWVLGDPLLSRGPGFAYLVERSLAQGVPLIGSGEFEVKSGAVYCSRADKSALAERAAMGIDLLLEKGTIDPRIDTAPGGGTIFYRPGLAKRFGLSPSAPAWQESQ
jgi:hypothetical protein